MTALPTPPSYNVKGQTKQSKKMPYWLWYIIAKSLGIKLHPRDKPLLAIILHAITLFSGGGMFLTRIWFSGTQCCHMYLCRILGQLDILLLNFTSIGFTYLGVSIFNCFVKKKNSKMRHLKKFETNGSQ